MRMLLFLKQSYLRKMLKNVLFRNFKVDVEIFQKIWPKDLKLEEFTEQVGTSILLWNNSVSNENEFAQAAFIIAMWQFILCQIGWGCKLHYPRFSAPSSVQVWILETFPKLKLLLKEVDFRLWMEIKWNAMTIIKENFSNCFKKWKRYEVNISSPNVTIVLSWQCFFMTHKDNFPTDLIHSKHINGFFF